MSGSTGCSGLIPVVGAIPDFLFRSNTRNLKIIKRHLDKHHAAHRDRSKAKSSAVGAPRPGDPVVLPFDLIGDWAAVAVGAGPERKRCWTSRQVNASSSGTPLERVTAQRLTLPLVPTVKTNSTRPPIPLSRRRRG